MSFLTMQLKYLIHRVPCIKFDWFLYALIWSSLINSGFTGLAHPSPLEIGRTHGVYVLESSSQTSSLTQQCRKFLHKPSIELMKETKNCVHELATSDTTDEVVLTDSCYFISPESCHKLLSFYEKHKPLTCEVDAYGDFLQVNAVCLLPHNLRVFKLI